MALDQHIIDLGTKELAKLADRLDQLQAEWTDTQARRNAWVLILGESIPETKVESMDEEVQSVKSAPEESDSTSLARKAIGATGKYGFKPRDITTKVEAMGIKLASGFASNLLFRMKKKGEVVEYGGKYYLPQFDPRPAALREPAQDQQQTPP